MSQDNHLRGASMPDSFIEGRWGGCVRKPREKAGHQSPPCKQPPERPPSAQDAFLPLFLPSTGGPVLNKALQFHSLSEGQGSPRQTIMYADSNGSRRASQRNSSRVESESALPGPETRSRLTGPSLGPHRRCELWTAAIPITWELARNTEPPALPQSHRFRICILNGTQATREHIQDACRVLLLRQTVHVLAGSAMSDSV